MDIEKIWVTIWGVNRKDHFFGCLFSWYGDVQSGTIFFFLAGFLASNITAKAAHKRTNMQDVWVSKVETWMNVTI
jgi:hypothetical protein